MPDINRRETGGRVPKEATGKEPQDEFDQDAAGNKRPPHGVGLTEDPAEERSETDKSDHRGGSVAGHVPPDAKKSGSKEIQTHLPEDIVRPDDMARPEDMARKTR